ncbi:AAA family ATPase [Halobacteriovorax sp. XZX-3]|uniref:ATP-dependent nuclease n=1 Tax=unclassified Halobacteriovorax TaxID=2639665 RepID=UPI003724076B
MNFIILESFFDKKHVYDENMYILVNTKWDDNFEFQVEYSLNIQKAHSKETNYIGTLKLGEKGQTNRNVNIEKNIVLNQLPENLFSLGQSEEYYNNLKNVLSPSEIISFFRNMNDVAFDLNIFEEVKNENVTKKSLLRYVFENTVKEQFHRIANGGDKFTGYELSFMPKGFNKDMNILEFHVDPNSKLSSNIHVLIGRNGVGKSFLMNSMVSNILYNLTDNGLFLNDVNIASLVVSSFSAFDKYYPVSLTAPSVNNIAYKYIGLKKDFFNHTKNKLEKVNKDTDDLISEFADLVFELINDSKKELWIECIKNLETDPIFKSVNIGRLVDFNGSKEDFIVEASTAFDRLSSGHKIIILTISSLVEMVSEKSLVILDEPEGHLHPPLLAAFMRTLSNLLKKKNGLAIISTHSPVVLQEVPSSCVWQIEREGGSQVFKRLNIKPFAENVGILTREVFGLEVIESGYHSLLRKLSEENDNYESIMDTINNDIGDEGKGILMSLLINK